MTDRKGLADLLESRIGQAFDGECHLVENEARQIAAALRQEPSVEEVMDAVLDACRQYADMTRAYVGRRRDVHTGYILTEAAQAIAAMYRREG